jgi:hypothetical protein
MNFRDFINSAQAVEYNFANLFNVNFTADAFEEMLDGIKGDLSYHPNDIAYDMRSGLLYLYSDASSITEAPASIQMAPKACALVAAKKIKLLKKHGLIDMFSRIILSDFCRIPSHQARELSQGCTPQMFDACLSNASFYFDLTDVDSRFVPSVMMIALVSDAPVAVVKESGQCKGQLADFIRMTKRRDLFPLLDAENRRDFLEDDFSM